MFTAAAFQTFAANEDYFSRRERQCYVRSLQPDGSPAYRIDYVGKPIVLESRLGLLPDFTNGFEIKNISHSEHKGEWTQVYGERKIIPDNYHELNVELKKSSGELMLITFRAYDEGYGVSLYASKTKCGEIPFHRRTKRISFPGKILSVTKSTAPKANIGAQAFPTFNRGASVP